MIRESDRLPLKSSSYNRCVDRMSTRCEQANLKAQFWKSTGDQLVREHKRPLSGMTDIQRQEVQKYIFYGGISALTCVPTLLFDIAAISTAEPALIGLGSLSTGVTVYSGFQAARSAWRAIHSESTEPPKIDLQQQLLDEGRELSAKFESFSQKIADSTVDSRHPLRTSLAKIQTTVSRMLNTAQGRSRPSLTTPQPSFGPKKSGHKHQN